MASVNLDAASVLAAWKKTYNLTDGHTEALKGDVDDLFEQYEDEDEETIRQKLKTLEQNLALDKLVRRVVLRSHACP